MSRWLLTLTAASLLSCTAPSATPTEAVVDLGELDDVSSPVPALAPDSDPIAVEPAPTMPGGVFATLSDLCEAQQRLITPTLAVAQASVTDRGDDAILRPHCELSRTALEHVTIDLAPPILEIAALDIETGFAIETHLAVRTSDGWISVPHASLVAFHDDPGCFTMERDAGLVSIRVVGDDAPRLALIEQSARGAVMDDREENGVVRVETFDDVTERSIECDLASNTFTCGQPMFVSVTRVASGT